MKYNASYSQMFMLTDNSSLESIKRLQDFSFYLFFGLALKDALTFVEAAVHVTLYSTYLLKYRY
jgi:hypothetical protein